MSGSPQVGETLTANTSAIADADGLTNAVCRPSAIMGHPKG